MIISRRITSLCHEFVKLFQVLNATTYFSRASTKIRCTTKIHLLIIKWNCCIQRKKGFNHSCQRPLGSHPRPRRIPHEFGSIAPSFTALSYAELHCSLTALQARLLNTRFRFSFRFLEFIFTVCSEFTLKHIWYIFSFLISKSYRTKHCYSNTVTLVVPETGITNRKLCFV